MAITSIGGMLTSLPGASAPQAERRGNRSPRRSAAWSRIPTKPASDANVKVAAMLDGSGDVHDAMIAMQRADLRCR